MKLLLNPGGPTMARGAIKQLEITLREETRETERLHEAKHKEELRELHQHEGEAEVLG